MIPQIKSVPLVMHFLYILSLYSCYFGYGRLVIVVNLTFGNVLASRINGRLLQSRDLTFEYQLRYLC
jgi:hypothetical protein